MLPLTETYEECKVEQHSASRSFSFELLKGEEESAGPSDSLPFRRRGSSGVHSLVIMTLPWYGEAFSLAHDSEWPVSGAPLGAGRERDEKGF